MRIVISEFMDEGAVARLAGQHDTCYDKSLVDQRLMWIQRIHAELFQHGIAVPEAQIRSTATRAWLAGDDVALTGAPLPLDE